MLAAINEVRRATQSAVDAYERRFHISAAVTMARARMVAVVFLLAQAALYVPPTGQQLPVAWWTLPAAALIVVAAISAVGLAASRSDRTPTRRAGAVAEVVGDAMLVVALLFLFAFDHESHLWALMMLPTTEAAWRFRFPGALLAWGLLATTYLGRDLVAAASFEHIDFAVESVTYRTGLVLIMTVVVASLSQAMRRTAVAYLAASQRHFLRARTDALTGLPNRDELLRLLGDEIGRARRMAVVTCDLDGFKRLNEAYGYLVGDEVLAAVARNLAGAVREGDLVARFGGDEFTAVFHGVDGAYDAQQLAQRMQASIAEPVTVAGRSHRLTAAAAVVLVDGRQSDIVEVQRDLDLAMALAKAQGRGALVHFASWMLERMQRRTQLMEDLGTALADGGLDVVYQPLIRADDGAVAGFEALVRWQHATFGMVPPMEVVELAGDAGVAVWLAEHVITESCREIAAWHRADAPRFVTVNLGTDQVTDPEAMLAMIEAELASNHLGTDALVLEITETTALDRADAISELLAAARKRGVRVAIDDFGRDQSSLSRLRTLGVDLVKLDKDLVVDLTSGDRDVHALRSVVALVASFGYDVLAEGIESQVQHDAVVDAGCRYLQGYLYSPPLLPEEVTRWLGQWRQQSSTWFAATSATSPSRADRR